MNDGIIFEVMTIKRTLNLLELNKYLIPMQVFSAKIDEICSVQYGVLVEKILRIDIKIKGKKVSIYLFLFLSARLHIVPIIAKKLQGKNVDGMFQK